MKDTVKTSAIYLGLFLLVACLNVGSGAIAVAESAVELEPEVLQGVGDEPDRFDLDDANAVASLPGPIDLAAAPFLPGTHVAPLFSSQHATPCPIRAPPTV